MRTTAQLLVFTLTVTALGAARQTQTPLSNLRAEIEALNASMVAAFKRAPEGVAKFYADDALIVGGGQRAHGRAQVDAYWRAATMFRDWQLEVLHIGGTPDAPWLYGRSRLVGASGRTMETFFLGLLRRTPSGQLQWAVDAFSRDQRTIGATETERISDAWRKAVNGDEALRKRLLDDPFSILLAPNQASADQRPALSQPRTGGRRSPFDGPEATVLDTRTVNVPLVKDGGFYYADVDLNGRPFRLTVETGAAFFAISNRAAQALGLTIESMEVMPGTPSPVATLDSVRLGGAMFRNVTARVRSEWDGGGFDGIISLALLRDVLATLDFASKTLRLERGELPPPNKRDVLAMAGEDRAGRVDIPITIGAVRVAAVVDTRADFWLIVPKTMESELALAGPTKFVANAFGPSVGAFELHGARLAADVRIGELTLERPAILVRDRPSVLIGVPLLEQFALTIDQKNRRVRISAPAGRLALRMPEQPWENTQAASEPRPSRGASPQDPTSGTWTLGFMLAGAPGGRLTVARVFPGSSAERERVQVGDVVVDVDGTPAASMNPGVARTLAARQEPFKLTVQRSGNPVTFVLTPHRIP